MARLRSLLIAALYLLPQAAGALHSFEKPEDCRTCEEPVRLECGDVDCDDAQHHHHRGAHDPATCRVCTAGATLTPPPLACIITPEPISFESGDIVTPRGSTLLLWGSIRAPPGSPEPSV